MSFSNYNYGNGHVVHSKGWPIKVTVCKAIAVFVFPKIPIPCLLKENEFAFSDPTMDGIQFATKYMGFEEFLVYNRWRCRVVLILKIEIVIIFIFDKK